MFTQPIFKSEKHSCPEQALALEHHPSHTVSESVLIVFNNYFLKCQKSFHPTKHIGDIIYTQNNVETGRKCSVLCRTFAHRASSSFSDPFHVDAKYQFGKFTFSNTSASPRARPLAALTIHQKPKGFERRAQSHHSAAIHQQLLCPLFGYCALEASFPFPSQSPLFVLHTLIHFKLLPSSSPLPPRERVLLCPRGAQSNLRLSLCAR